MARGKVQLRRIENPVHRQVTFCKRRGGLLKKAKELSVLCEAEIGIIIFSAQGKLYEQATNGTMEDLIQRYKKTCGDSQAENGEASQPQEMQQEILLLKQERDLLQKRQRYDSVIIANGRTEKIASGLLDPFLSHLKIAEDQIAKGRYSIRLEPGTGTDTSWFTKDTIERYMLGEGTAGQMTPDELQALERHLEIWIYNIRAAKMQLMIQEIQTLKNMEGMLKTANETLQGKIGEQNGLLNARPTIGGFPYPLTIQNGIFNW